MKFSSFTASTPPKRATTNLDPPNLLHESRIPPIATKVSAQPASIITADTQYTTLSFALPTSMAIFKRLTWELTPWTRPLHPSTARIISAHLPTLPSSSISLALCLGVAYTDTSYGAKHHRPHLYVLFPHLRHDASEDETFLSIWHNEMIKPAFDEAWVQSGLVDVYERTQGGTVWITEKAGPTAKEVYDRYYDSEYPWLLRPQHRVWPAWSDAWAYRKPPAEEEGTLARGIEGGYSDKRARVFEEAWSSMQGMLRGDGYPGEMSDPVLLAVWEREMEAEDAGSLARKVGREWDAYADSRYVKEGDFFVHLDECIHESRGEDEFEDGEVEEDEEGSEDVAWIGTIMSMLGL